MDYPYNTPGIVEMPVIFKLVRISASQGDETDFPPTVGLYRNVLLNYEVNNHTYIYSSDGIPVLLTGKDGSASELDFNNLTNRPSYAGVEMTSATNIPEVPTVNNATLTVQKNGTSVGTFTANSATDTTINLTVPVTASDVSALPASTKYATSLSLTIDSSTYVVTGQLKDQDGNNLGSAQTIDLPLESVVVNGSYDSSNKKIILTLQNGQTVDIPVGDLISGLQSEITAQNKLSADLVDDSTTTNKFVTASDKTAWNGKQNALTAGTNITISGDTISATDTTYSDFSGATSGAAGTHGLVPAPASGETDKYLKSDGSWATVSQYALPAATASTLGGVKIGTNLSMDSNDVLSATDTTYTAGTNVSISAQNVISATDTTYTAGTNVSISAQNVISATDTTYSAFTGATSGSAGTTGLVPAPAAGDQGKFLKADGTWDTAGGGATVYDSTISLTNNGSALDSFTVNASSNKTIALDYPVITMQTTDPGEGQPLAANHFIAVYS